MMKAVKQANTRAEIYESTNGVISAVAKCNVDQICQ
jgi:hypothetical protein